ncbi:MAG TPA: sulfur carrier protein ThiS [Desulfobacterales bacterium]|jgi:sulfur carrier protein ThiS|nr:sulfur carrier protein ThiS [Desulfobacterales bacterium]
MIRVAGEERPWRAGLTVADLVRESEDAQDCPVVRVNDHYVSRPNFAATLVPDDAEVFFIPMIAGG